MQAFSLGQQAMKRWWYRPIPIGLQKFGRTAVLESKRSRLRHATPTPTPTTTPATPHPQYRIRRMASLLSKTTSNQIGTPQYQLAFKGSEERPCLCPGDSALQPQTIHTSTTINTSTTTVSLNDASSPLAEDQAMSGGTAKYP